MADTDYVNISVTQSPQGLTKVGFGTLMHLSYNFGGSVVERSRTYSKLAGVVTDFPLTNGPEQIAARAWFGQSPQPTKMIIGRGTNKPTKIISLSAISPTTALTFIYLINVTGPSITPTQVTFTSDGTPTDAEWAAGIVSALNAVVGKNYTAAGASSPVTVTGNSPGAWFSLEIVDVNHMKQTETTADPGVGADILAINAENKQWYCLDTAYNSTACVVAGAATIEAMGNRIYVVASQDTNIITVATTGTADVMDQAKTNAYKRTSVHYHPNPAAAFAAALAAENLTADPGTETWALDTVSGPAVVALLDTHRTNIVAKNGNSYETAFGIGTSFNGMMADGSFIDTRRAIDFIVSGMSLVLFLALKPFGGKLPETDDGYATLGAVVRGFLKSVSTPRTPIVDPTTIVVTLVARVDVPAGDILTRAYNGINWSATVQGAVHKVGVTGQIGGA